MRILTVLLTIAVVLTCAPAQAATAGLEQTVSYQGCARLHTVLEQLTRSTGITLSAGRDDNDWPVRDIPVVVCVKDLPLSVLVQALADATHCGIVSSGSGTRILRTREQEKQFAAYEDQLAAFRAAFAQWVCDLTLCLKDIPEPPVTNVHIKNAYDAFEYAQARALGRLVDAIGPEARQRIVNIADEGGFEISAATAPEKVRTALVEYVQAETAADNAYKSPPVLPFPPDVAMKCSWAVVRFGDDLNSDIGMNTSNGSVGTGQVLWNIYTWANAVGLPCGSNRPHPPGSPYGLPTDRASVYQDIKESGIGLSAKALADLPKKATRADGLIALAKANKLNLVSEDYESLDGQGGFKIDNAKPLADVFDNARCKLIDPSHRLVLGIDPNWGVHEVNMLPETFVQTMRQKANTTGLDFQDWLGLVRLTLGQRRESVERPCDASFLVESRDKSLWLLYDDLTLSQKRAVLSKSGLHISRLDQDKVVAALQEHNSWLTYKLYEPDYKPYSYFPVDPGVLSTMVMKLRLNAHPPEISQPGCYGYNLSFTFRQNGKEQSVEVHSHSLPIFPYQKMQALRAAASK